MIDQDHVRIRLGRNISDAVRQLLSDKHLYQSVNVDVAFLDEVAEAHHKAERVAAARALSPGRPGRVPEVEEIRGTLDSFVRAPWFPSGARPLVDTGMDILFENDPKVQKYPLPTVKLTCNHCGEPGPFNPVGALVETGRRARDNQWTYLSYECQNCKGEPIRFLIRRKRTKLTLSGRDPFETIELPSFVPKQHADNLRNALIANHAGQTLAGIFLMRVFIEQFWKSIPDVVTAVKHKARPTGDELAEAYKATLPQAFKERFPTLAETYDVLSDDMHAARGDATVFEKGYDDIVEHFDARRLFKLLSTRNDSQPDETTSEKEESI
jgi:hypothetical protein